jgi:dCTP deaminase
MHHPELQREFSTGTTGAQNSGQKGVIGTYDGTIKTARPVRQTVPQGMGFLLLKETVMTGVLPSQDLKTMIKEGVINAQPQIISEQIQPASLDLRLGTRAYRVRASFLSGENQTVSSRLAEFQMHEIDLHQGAVLEKGCVYVVPLMEQLDLPAGTHAVTNAKSSTGRLDLLTRTISDYSTEFDRIAPGYRGPLYAEICPRSFSVLVRPGMRLNQIRFRAGQAILTDAELDALH